MNPHPLSSRRDQGSILSVVLISLLPVSALVIAATMRSDAELHTYRHRLLEYRVTQLAKSGLSIAKSVISNSGYTGNNNDALMAPFATPEYRPHSRNPAAGYAAINIDTGSTEVILDPTTPPLDVVPFVKFSTYNVESPSEAIGTDPNEEIDVWIAQIDTAWYTIESTARFGNIERTVRVFVRNKDLFTRFSMFYHKYRLYLDRDWEGDIQGNAGITIVGAGLCFTGPVNSTSPIAYQDGADPTNTYFTAGYTESSPWFPIVDWGYMDKLGKNADPAYWVNWDYENARIELLGTDVKVTATNMATGMDEVVIDSPLPANEILTVSRNVSGLSGTINGRLTIVVTDETSITGSLVYVDDDGDTACINADNPAAYGPNPNYDGDCFLGIASYNTITLSSSMPNQAELNCALYTSNHMHIEGMDVWGGSTSSVYDPTFTNASLCHFGALLIDGHLYTSVYDATTTAFVSGFEVNVFKWDRNLKETPPRFFPEIERPWFLNEESLNDHFGF